MKTKKISIEIEVDFDADRVTIRETESGDNVVLFDAEAKQLTRVLMKHYLEKK